MLANGMAEPWLRRLACTGLLVVHLTGCKVYDAQLLDRGSAGRGGGGVDAGAAGEQAEACVPAAETCNAADDDCNGIVDDQPLASEDCSRRYHASVNCGRGGVCLFVPAKTQCDPGYYHCDGLPETGCESTTPCCEMCSDAGLDSGADDAGSDPPGEEDAG